MKKQYNGIVPLFGNCVNIDGRIYTPEQAKEHYDKQAITANLQAYSKRTELAEMLILASLSGLLVVGFILFLQVMR